MPSPARPPRPERWPGGALGGSEPPAERTEGRSRRGSGEGSRHWGEAPSPPPPRLPAGLRLRPCRRRSVRSGQSCLPRRYPPGGSVSAAGAAALPARLRAESKHRGRRQPPFFSHPGSLSTGSPPSSPDPPRRARLPSPAAPESRCCPASAEAATPKQHGLRFLSASFASLYNIHFPCHFSLPCAATQQRSTGGALPFIAVSSLPARRPPRGARPAQPAPRSPATPLTLLAPPTPWAFRIRAAPPPASCPATPGGTFSGDTGPPGAGWCRPAPATRPLPGRHGRQNRTCHRRHRPGAAAAPHPPGRAKPPPPPFSRLGSAGEGGVPLASCCI